MVDLLTIQTIGVILAAFSFVVSTANTIRVSINDTKKNKIEYTNNVLNTLCSEEGWKRYIELMSMEWTDFQDFKKKYDSTASMDAYAKRQTFLTQLDSIGYLYKNNLLDKETLYQIGGNVSMWGYAKFKNVMDEYRKESWPKDLFSNIDILARDMYKMTLLRDPGFRLDADYFTEEDHLALKPQNSH